MVQEVVPPRCGALRGRETQLVDALGTHESIEESDEPLLQGTQGEILLHLMHYNRALMMHCQRSRKQSLLKVSSETKRLPAG